MLKEGMFIQERYEIISKIGSGGMADVYKAKDHKLNRFVAIKVLKRELREDKAFISKFRVEAQSAAGLEHPNIVNVYDVGEEQEINYIVMELVEGITLKEYIEKKGRLTVREATSIALQVAMGLDAAHNNNIVHRDVKPQNIIISTDGKVKVTDFGIARAATSQTINSSVMGSVHYSSPEQARGGYSDFKSDIYSLGITMYEMVTGHVPYDGDSTVAIALKHLQEEMQSPRKFVPDLPKSTVQIIYKCTQKSPDRRYNDIEELIRDMKESLVNPEGDFVQLIPLGSNAQTVVLSKDEMEQIKSGQEEGTYGNYATGGTYGSPYGTGAYQEEPYEDDEELEEDEKVHPKLEKFMTIGSIVIGIIILLIFVVLVGNAMGFINLDFLTKSNETEAVSESSTDTSVTDSDSTESVDVPDLAGMTEDQAKTALNKLGLGAVYGGEKESAEYTAGLIASQTPAAGSSVTKNTQVTYYISIGSTETVSVPDVSGLTLTAAQTQLSAVGLTVTAEYAYDSTVAEGLVIYSNPTAGSSVDSGSTVTVVISNGAQTESTSTSDDTVTVPYVIGQTSSSAQSTLEGLGLYVSISEEVSSSYSAGTVMSQSIDSGTQVSKGTTVSLVVSVAGDPEEEGGSAEEDADANNNTYSYACNVDLTAPSDYAGEVVKIVVEQDGNSTTVSEGTAVSFPYNLNVTGTSDSVGTAYIYVTKSDGSVSTYTYNNIPFKQVS